MTKKERTNLLNKVDSDTLFRIEDILMAASLADKVARVFDLDNESSSRLYAYLNGSIAQTNSVDTFCNAEWWEEVLADYDDPEPIYNQVLAVIEELK